METTTIPKFRWRKPYKITLAVQLFADIAILVVSIWLAVYSKTFVQTLNVPWGILTAQDATYNFIISVTCFNGTTSCTYFSGGYIAYGCFTLTFFFGTAAEIYGTSILLNGFLCDEGQDESILWKQLIYWRRVNFVNLIRDIIFLFISLLHSVIYLIVFLFMIVLRAMGLVVGFVYTTSVKTQLEINFERELTE